MTMTEIFLLAILVEVTIGNVVNFIAFKTAIGMVDEIEIVNEDDNKK